MNAALSALQADYPVQEIDGVPMAYMELTDGDETVRFTYITVAYQGKDRDQVEAALQTNISEIKAALQFRCVELGIGSPTILWRVRPGIEGRETPGYVLWTARCRLATSPPLSMRMWGLWGNPKESTVPKWIEPPPREVSP